MVTPDSFPEEKESINEIEKEISILSSLGVEDYEIKYLLYLKRKRETGLKWRD